MADEIQLPHERLLAYRYAIELLRLVQEMKISDARLNDQIIRAAKSVCLNIAEGVGRVSDADKKRVYAIARGECCETAAAIDVARVAGECDLDQGTAARKTAGRVYALLTGLMRRYDVETFGSPKTSQPPPNELEDENEIENEVEHEHEHAS